MLTLFLNKAKQIQMTLLKRIWLLLKSRFSLRYLIVLIALAFIGMFLLTALPRIFYPYDLDFIEDSMLMQSLRVANGLPIFVPPSVEFVPHLYMPLYSWLGGLLIKIFGVGYAPLRLLSFAATIISTLMIYFIARRENQQRWIAFVCAGLFLGGYRISGFWYELVRVDSLFVALSIGGCALGIYAGRSNRRLMLAAIVLTLAFFTKQTSLLFGAALAVYLLITIGRRAWLFIGAYATLVISALFIVNALTNGWFIYHTFTIAASDPIEGGRIINYLRFELFGVMAVLSVMAIIIVGLSWHRLKLQSLRNQPWLITIGAAAIISGVGRASAGGNLNNLMIVYALMCLAPALLVRETESRSRSKTWGRVISIGLALQFVLGVYNPLRTIPTSEMRQAGDRLIERIASIDGEVYVAMHPYYAWLAGKQPSAQLATIWYGREHGQLPLPEDFVARLRDRYYAAIISDESFFEIDPPVQQLFTQTYQPLTQLDVDAAPATLTGVVVRPQVIYGPK
jgi:4-amino-4-deoxy-L-arabinose transferase-like glycosyltransferase